MIEKILNEISRLKIELKGYSALEALNYIEAYINAISKEPASEDLEEAAQEYSFNIPTQLEADIVWKKETEQHFKDGAKWQKQKDQETIELAEEHAMLAGMEKMREEMMKDAVDAFVNTYENTNDINYVEFVTEQSPYKFKETEKCKLIIIKEEQQ